MVYVCEFQGFQDFVPEVLLQKRPKGEALNETPILASALNAGSGEKCVCCVEDVIA